MISPDTLRRIAKETLGNCDSFILSPILPSEFKAARSDVTDQIVGVYLNSPTDYLIVSEKGITCFKESTEELIEYRHISQVTAPGDGDQDLDLLLENSQWGDVYCRSIAVLGITDDLADIEEFHSFIIQVLEKTQLEPIDLKSISSRKDLIDFLRYDCKWQEYTDALANYLEQDFTDTSFSKYNVDPDLAKSPEFWRALAVVLNVPIRMHLEEVRDPVRFANSAELP